MTPPPQLRIDTLPPPLRALVRRFEATGDRVTLLDVTTNSRIPSVVAVLASDRPECSGLRLRHRCKSRRGGRRRRCPRPPRREPASCPPRAAFAAAAVAGQRLGGRRPTPPITSPLPRAARTPSGSPSSSPPTTAGISPSARAPRPVRVAGDLDAAIGRVDLTGAPRPRRQSHQRRPRGARPRRLPRHRSRLPAAQRRPCASAARRRPPLRGAAEARLSRHRARQRRQPRAASVPLGGRPAMSAPWYDVTDEPRPEAAFELYHENSKRGRNDGIAAPRAAAAPPDYAGLPILALADAAPPTSPPRAAALRPDAGPVPLRAFSDLLVAGCRPLDGSRPGRGLRLPAGRGVAAARPRLVRGRDPPATSPPSRHRHGGRRACACSRRTCFAAPGR